MVIMMNWPGRSDKRHASEPFLLSLDVLYTQTLLIDKLCTVLVSDKLYNSVEHLCNIQELG
jgi:hypothetical protein